MYGNIKLKVRGKEVSESEFLSTIPRERTLALTHARNQVVRAAMGAEDTRLYGLTVDA